MKIKILFFLMFGIISLASVSLAQSRDPGTVGQSSSTGVWPSVDSGTSAGYSSGDHGNVN